MRNTLAIITLLFVFVLFVFPLEDQRLLAQSQNYGQQVTELFTNRCLKCHGPEAFNGRGAGGVNYILDFDKLIENKEIIPGDPEKSELFELVDAAEMPEDGTAPLDPEDIELIRNWIISLAEEKAQTEPALEPVVPAEETEDTSAEETVETATEEGSGDSDPLIQYLGKFHPMVVHFPIALILFAGLFELLSVPRWISRYLKLHEDTLRQAARLCLIFAALISIVTALLGWFNAAFSNYPAEMADTLEQHRWTGTILAVLTVITVFLNRIRFQKLTSSNKHSGATGLIFAISLLILCVLVIIVGHLGGTLVFGLEYFNW